MIKHKYGFTLIEIAIVLTIVGLIIGGIWMAASVVINNNKKNTFEKEVLQIIRNTKAIYAGQNASGTAIGFTVPVGVTAGIFPPEMISSAGTAANPVIVTPFSTDLTVNTLIGPRGDDNLQRIGDTTAIELIFGTGTQGLPQDACVHMLLTLGSLQNIQSLGIGDVWTAGHQCCFISSTQPMTPARASSECDMPGNQNYLDVYFSIF